MTCLIPVLVLVALLFGLGHVIRYKDPEEATLAVWDRWDAERNAWLRRYPGSTVRDHYAFIDDWHAYKKINGPVTEEEFESKYWLKWRK